MGSRINLTHHCFLEPATDVWDSTFLSCLLLFITFYYMYVQVCPFRCYYLKVFWLVGVPSWKLWLKPLLTAAPPPAAVNRTFDQGMFGSHVLATKCTKIWMMHECCLGSRTWEGRDVRKRRYVSKKIFQGLEQTVFIAILLTSTGIPMQPGEKCFLLY